MLEWYDFYIYGTAATIVLSPLFFPNLDATNAPLAAFASYGIGFLLKSWAASSGTAELAAPLPGW